MSVIQAVTNKVLHVDLTTGQVREIEISYHDRQNYLG